MDTDIPNNAQYIDGSRRWFLSRVFNYFIFSTQMLWHILGVAVVVFAASALIWESYLPWQITGEDERLFLVVLWPLFSLGGLIFVSLVVHFPRVNWLWANIIGLLASNIALLMFHAASRFYYSRAVIVFGLIFLIIWTIFGYFIWILPGKIEMLLIPGGAADRLTEMPGNFIKWITPKSPEEAGRIFSDDISLRAVSVDFPSVSEEWIGLLEELKFRGAPIYHSGTLYENLTGRVSVDNNPHHLLADLEIPNLYLSFRRFLETIFILALSPILIPIFILTALIIRIESPGPILFWQERVGLLEKRFDMVKFRSMVIDAESDGAKTAEKSDVRITGFGKFIRKLRIDELPQFYNVLRGEMSLIGPRPEQVSYVEQYNQNIPVYRYRHLVRPGITGWAQVNGGYAVGVEANKIKAEYDLYYIKYLSLSLDLLLIFKTLRTIVTGSGAR